MNTRESDGDIHALQVALQNAQRQHLQAIPEIDYHVWRILQFLELGRRLHLTRNSECGAIIKEHRRDLLQLLKDYELLP